MPKRRELLVTGEYYHIYNCSIGYEKLFFNKRAHKRFLSVLKYYKFSQPTKYSRRNSIEYEIKTNKIIKKKSLINIYAYALMPNHYHLLAKQLAKNGIREYISKVQNSYAKYFNLKRKRLGGLFLKPFKAKRIENDELFLHISRYIHLNPVTSYLIGIKELDCYKYTSFYGYCRGIDDKISEKDKLVELSGSVDKYKKFVVDQADYQRNLQKIKSISLD